MKAVTVGDVTFANDKPFVLIAGPCQIESRDHAFMMAEKIKTICDKLKIPFIYKSSYDKANRSSVSTQRGIGIDEGLQILSDVRAQFSCPVLTDIHDAEQAVIAGKAVDVLQIPAFLCRQTDLLLAAGKTGKAINVKKGQFLAPWDMKNVAQKIASTGNENILLCERGASFGYNTLVSDMRALPIMAQTGYPVVFDATHSVQQPGGQGTTSGGQREFAPVLARAACAVGVGGIFIETHQDPDRAPSDGPNMIKIENLEGVLRVLKQIDDFAKANPVNLAA
ncbi:MAG: 3-deoxy-8-phosphooctulonate synthase [Bdellovibrionales bacterium]